MKHYFLGLGAGYSKKERRAILFSHGKETDLIDLREYIRKEYQAHQVLITKNGRSAIAAGLKYYFNDSGEVIVNGLTCRAVIQGVKAAGMTPIYADVDKKTLNFTTESLKKVFTKNTRAIIIQNSLGNMAPICEIEKFAKQNNLVIMEDLAHCTGRKYEDGREAGMVGKITIFTFGKDKTIDTVSGGAVAFRDSVAPLAKIPKRKPKFSDMLRIRLYPSLGATCRALSYVKLSGIFMRFLISVKLIQRSAEGNVDFKNERLSYFQAKLALEQLKNREKNAKKPLREFYLVNDREKVLDELKKAGYYFSGFWYEKPVIPERYYQSSNFPEKDCPNAVFISEHIINLPNYYTKKELEPARKIISKHLLESEK